MVKAFPGDKGPGTKALPDNVDGVGENHLVDFTSANFVVHDRCRTNMSCKSMLMQRGPTGRLTPPARQGERHVLAR
jgi:hypothetical protein